MGDWVACVPRALTLSSSACVADWARAQARRPQPWESRWHCRACPTGARLAGVSVEDTDRSVQRDAVMHLCVRCHRVTSRILLGRYCISCYNREREMLTGKNAKGTAPTVLLARLAPRTIVVHYRGRDDLWVAHPVNRAASYLEAVFATMRAEGCGLVFGRGYVERS